MGIQNSRAEHKRRWKAKHGYFPNGAVQPYFQFFNQTNITKVEQFSKSPLRVLKRKVGARLDSIQEELREARDDFERKVLKKAVAQGAT